MFQAIWTIAEGLSGAFGFVVMTFLVSWLVTRHDHDYDGYGDSIEGKPSELELAQRAFVLSGTRETYDEMLSLVRAPSALRWYNSADEPSCFDEADRKSDLSSETQAMWAEMVKATEFRSGGIIVAPNDYRVEFPELPGALNPPCGCNACRLGDYQAWLIARDVHNRAQVGGTSPRAQRISQREYPTLDHNH